MKLIQVCPQETYFLWQLYVQMLNFREVGVENQAVILLVGDTLTPDFQKFKDWTTATVLCYPDTRETKLYLSSIRPNIIKQYLKEHPTKVFFYHDQDIIFLERPPFEKVEKDSFCYVAAEAMGYTYSKYLKAFKGGDLFPKMCKIIGISPELVESNDENCGGAQYIIRNTDYDFWNKVEKDCEALYKFLWEYTNEDRINKIYHVQIWAADMWALLWNILLRSEVRHLKMIDFCWPYNTFEDAARKGIIIMHNAGISEHNRNNSRGRPVYFDKGLFRNKTPFNDSFNYIDKNILQYKYVQYFKHFQTNSNMNRKILAVWNSTYGRTSRKIHPELVKASLAHLKKAADSCKIPVKVITTTWESIPGNPFEEIISPWRDLGHLNYLYQMKQQVDSFPNYDFVCVIEHDVLIPENYFDEVFDNWDYSKYGLNNRNYIGVNTTGYLDVKERHHPMSMMSFATFFFKQLLDEKIQECFKNVGPGYPNGWCCVEPDNKGLMKDHWFSEPCIHVSGKGLGEYYHNFTSHDIVCYEEDSKGKVEHPYWGHYLTLLPFLKQPQLV